MELQNAIPRKCSYKTSIGSVHWHDIINLLPDPIKMC